MKVYLAAPYAARDTVAGHAAELMQIGYTITASWLRETHQVTDGTTGPATEISDEQAAEHARQDFADINASDLFVVFTAAAVDIAGPRGHSGGRHVETGYALAMGRPVVVVGEPEHIFHRYAPDVTVCKDWHDTILELAHRLVVSHRYPRVRIEGVG